MQRVTHRIAANSPLDQASKAVTAGARAVLTRLPAPHDPSRISLQRSIRAAIVITLAFAFAKFVVGDIQFMTFIAFGCFAMLVLADFGGARRPRALAYVVACLAGAALVLLGAVASTNPIAAVLVTLLVGFSVQFSGVFGGYIAAAQPMLLLSFVLSVSIPATPASLAPRLAGWLLAGAISTLAGVFFWPHFERLMLRHQAGAACRALAALVNIQLTDPTIADLPQLREAAQAALAAVRRAYAATLKRPAGPFRRDRAFVELLSDLETTLRFLNRATQPQPNMGCPTTQEAETLSTLTVQAIEASADLLTGGAAPDLTALQEARLAHRQALDNWAEDALHAGTPPDEVLDGLMAGHTLRVLSYLALAIGGNAVIAAGKQAPHGFILPAGTPRHVGATGVALRIGRVLRTYLTPSSSVLHNSLRVGLGLALAVLLSRQLQIDHAFWVVLATLSVLRSNAFATGRTTLDALTGSAIGFVIGALCVFVIGGASVIFWILLPLTIFLASYAPAAISFVVGQAAFTLYVIVLFNIISPVGWRIGLVRVEDVAIGAAISVVVGLLLWPRGGRGDLRRALALLYRDMADYLRASLRRVVERESAATIDHIRGIAIQARDRADEAFDLFLHEKGAKPLDPQSAALLLATSTQAIVTGDLINLNVEMGYQARGRETGLTAIQAQTRVVIAEYLRLADQLDNAASAAGAAPRISSGALRVAAINYLRRWRDHPSGGKAAIAVAAAGEWIKQLDQLAADLAEPVGAIVEVARKPWWR